MKCQPQRNKDFDSEECSKNVEDEIQKALSQLSQHEIKKLNELAPRIHQIALESQKVVKSMRKDALCIDQIFNAADEISKVSNQSCGVNGEEGTLQDEEDAQENDKINEVLELIARNIAANQ